ncbi:Dicarboxylate transport [Allopseudospirillum japonicum]|uniref:Dicarboxylate transport n=1 Tax=Allopseudospirillum japonicum TaxID=64971 RepID=A0A1H6T9M7_9GAMM|nr:YdbH domain-containing protein [Allopseudospirillum japonicum]SEI72542.1 Dicarboxylate transport [Allopseudospirillum japonicum]
MFWRGLSLMISTLAVAGCGLVIYVLQSLQATQTQVAFDWPQWQSQQHTLILPQLEIQNAYFHLRVQALKLQKFQSMRPQHIYIEHLALAHASPAQKNSAELFHLPAWRFPQPTWLAYLAQLPSSLQIQHWQLDLSDVQLHGQLNAQASTHPASSAYHIQLHVHENLCATQSQHQMVLTASQLAIKSQEITTGSQFTFTTELTQALHEAIPLHITGQIPLPTWLQNTCIANQLDTSKVARLTALQADFQFDLQAQWPAHIQAWQAPNTLPAQQLIAQLAHLQPQLKTQLHLQDTQGVLAPQWQGTQANLQVNWHLSSDQPAHADLVGAWQLDAHSQTLPWLGHPVNQPAPLVWSGTLNALSRVPLHHLQAWSWSQMRAQIQAQMQGTNIVNLEAQASQASLQPLYLQLDDWQLHLHSPQAWQWDQWQFAQGELWAQGQAQWDTQGLEMTWQHSKLALKEVHHLASQAALAGFNLQLQPGKAFWRAATHQLDTDLIVETDAQAVQATPHLPPFDWQGQLKLTPRLRQAWPFTFNGHLFATGQQTLASRWHLSSQGKWQAQQAYLDAHLSIQHQDISQDGLLPQLRFWPDSLSLQQGQVQMQVDFAGPITQMQNAQIQGQAHLQGLQGLYKTWSWRGLDLDLAWNTRAKHWRLQPKIQLAHLDIGVDIEHLAAGAQIDWPKQAATPWQIQLAPMQAEIFGGRLTSSARTYPQFQFAQMSQLAWPWVLYIEDVQLAQLLQEVHPHSGFQGEGVLAGVLPFVLYPDHLEVQPGALYARAPGGYLSYQVPNRQEIAAGNPALELALTALSEFYYQTLYTGLEYSPSGRLLLALRLQGYNPHIEQGRPIHFNIQLEEHLPSLLTSLQITQDLNQELQERIENYYYQQQERQ